MALREWMNANPRAAAITVAVVLVVALWLIFVRGRGASGTATYNYSYYYDLSSNQLFVDSNRLVPPIRDGKGAAARVFSCGDCADNSSRFIGWVEMYTPEAKAAMAAPAATDPNNPNAAAEAAGNSAIEAGHMIAPEPNAGEQPQWVPINSMPGSRIQQALLTKCSDGTRPKPCGPSRSEIP